MPARGAAEAGYTLIELLVVVIILGLLAAIVVIGVGNTRASANASVCRADVRSIQESAAAVATRTGSLPAVDVDGSTVANPLLFPAAGALLKTWPSNSSYSLAWSATANDVSVRDLSTNQVTLGVDACAQL